MPAGEIAGFVSVCVSVLFFGTCFVPVKQYDTGDGLYFQWWMCLGIFVVGYIVQVARDSPPFQPFAMLGGALWCTGNIMTVPTIQCMGMGLGMLIWGATNMLLGWASGKFGLFGLNPDDISDSTLNYAGVATALVALGCYFFITPNEPNTLRKSFSRGSVSKPLLNTTDGDLERVTEEAYIKQQAEDEEGTLFSNLSPSAARLLGIFMASIMGLFFGVSFDPAQYLMDTHDNDLDDDHPDNAEDNSLDFVFSHMCGIFLASSLYLGIYIVYCGGTSKMTASPEVRMPAIISGVMWAIAQTNWFVANGALGFAVAFPMITSGPGFIAALLGVFVFDEIKGSRNVAFLIAAGVLTGVANALIVMSR